MADPEPVAEAEDDQSGDQGREVEGRVEPASRGEIEADHVGEDDDVEERDLALKGPETLLEEDAPADALHLPGVDQPDQSPHAPPHEAGTRGKRLRGGWRPCRSPVLYRRGLFSG